jgi:hypothetical protein
MKQAPLLLLAIVLGCAAPLATAAEAAPETCASLSKKFDEADKSNVPADKLKQAERARRHARGLCATGNIAPGIRALKKALDLIGVK